MKRYLLPKWSKLDAKSVTRPEVKLLVIGRIAAPVLANQVLATASAIFSWGAEQEIIPLNPCFGIERHEVRSRERVLSDGEVARFWTAFDKAGLRALRSRPFSFLGSVLARLAICALSTSSMAGGNAGKTSRRMAGDQER